MWSSKGREAKPKLGNVPRDSGRGSHWKPKRYIQLITSSNGSLLLPSDVLVLQVPCGEVTHNRHDEAEFVGDVAAAVADERGQGAGIPGLPLHTNQSVE